MSSRLRIGVVFGGRSAEHEVSLVSATSVMKALDTQKYEVVPIGISPEGRWLSSSEALQLLKDKTPIGNLPEHVFVPDPHHKALMAINAEVSSSSSKPVDVIFPLIHGTYGEDGTIQGLFELADIPYVGAGVLGSAVGMDKVIQKQLLKLAKIPVTPDVSFLYSQYTTNQKQHIGLIERALRYPVFVKPPNLGSSVGISKAHNRKELQDAIDLAGEYDRKILVEQGVRNAREIECSVLGNDDPAASIPGEIIPSNEFYDYDAKYVDGKSRAEIPAKLTKTIVKKIQDYAVRAFKILDCAGMARVDFLVAKSTNRMYLNEINTLPGFTSISMYPKLWQASGLSYPRLLDKLIELAIERHAARLKLRTMYRPKNAWYAE
jgi:D-alanine-D-alanine ligase